MKTIGIIGQGFVGNAVYQKFSQFFDIKTYDLDPLKCTSPEEERKTEINGTNRKK